MMSAEAAFDALRNYKRELTGEGLSGVDVASFQAIFATWKPADKNPTALGDAAAFFASVRNSFGHLTQPQVEGFQTLLQEFGVARWPLSWCAYGLATAFHETAAQMQPVREAYWLTNSAANAYFFKMYDPQGTRPDVAKRLGNIQPGDGVKYCGRGYVQLTGRANYGRASEATGCDLVNHPELALQSDIAARIMIWGMETGAFTGKSLKNYLPLSNKGGHEAFKAARQIINGHDKDEAIAKEADSFQAALEAGNWQ